MNLDNLLALVREKKFTSTDFIIWLSAGFLITRFVVKGAL
jgi:hypothetical protein